MIRRAMHLLLAAGLAAVGALTLDSAAAQASSYTCAHNQAVNLAGMAGVSHVTMTVHWQCTDDKFHASGKLYDDKCDAQSARLALLANGFSLPDQPYYDEWEWDANTGNGCGTYSTFSMSEPEIKVASGDSSANLKIEVGACASNCGNWGKLKVIITYSGAGGCIIPAKEPAAPSYARIPDVIPC
jgi:hypothetical protein